MQGSSSCQHVLDVFTTMVNVHTGETLMVLDSRPPPPPAVYLLFARS